MLEAIQVKTAGTLSLFVANRESKLITYLVPSFFKPFIIVIMAALVFSSPHLVIAVIEQLFDLIAIVDFN